MQNSTNILDFVTGYLLKKDEDVLKETIIDYFLQQLSKICNLFEIDGFETPSEYILKYASINGHCGAFEKEGKIYVGIGAYTGEVDSDGLGKEYVVTLLNGETFRGTRGVNVAVLKNNNLGYSDIPSLCKNSKLLADTDISMMMNIIYTRVCPIPIVETDIEKKSMQNVLDNLFNGKFNIFKRNVGTKLLTGDNATTNVLNLTQPQASVYLQNLSRFHDELIIRQCLEMGISVTARDKGAQLNESELNAFTPYAMIAANDKITQLSRFIDECKRIFNRDFSFKVKDFYTMDEKGNADILNVKYEESNVLRETSENKEKGVDDNEALGNGEKEE